MKERLNLGKFAFIIILLLCSCSDNEGNDALIAVPDKNELNQELAANQLESKIHLVAKADWTASIDIANTRADDSNSWVSLSPSHGAAGTYDIVVKLDPNLTGKERKAIITIVCGDYRITIIIIQTSENNPDIPPVTPPSGTKYLLKRIVEMENENDVDEEYDFSYDELNRPVKIVCQWYDGDEPGTGNLLKDIWTFTYQDGKVIELFKDVNDKGGSSEIIEYCYTLDDKGRIQSWESKDTFNSTTQYSNGAFSYGINGEIMREDFINNNMSECSYVEWENGNKVKIGFESALDKENDRTNYDILTYTSYLNNEAINVDLNIFLHDSEAGFTFAADGYLKMFDGYLGVRSRNYMKSFKEHYSFNNGTVDLKEMNYEFDAKTGLPVKVTVNKSWNVNSGVDRDTDYYIFEYESVK